MAVTVRTSDDINELTQWALTREFIKDPTIKAFLPEKVKQSLPALESYRFPGILYTNADPNTLGANSTNETINYYISKKYDKKVLQVNNLDISSLVAHVEFFKVPTNYKGTVKLDFENKVPITFATHYNTNALKSIIQDPSGVGLRSVKIDVINNTGAFTKYQVTMDLYFANAKILVEDERYRDLLTTPTKDANGDVTYFIAFGWAKAVDDTFDRAEELYQERALILVNLINYDLSFNPDGSVGLSLNMLGSGEDDTKSINSDILSTPESRKNAELNVSRGETELATLKTTKTDLEQTQTAINEKIDKLKKELAEKEKLPQTTVAPGATSAIVLPTVAGARVIEIQRELEQLNKDKTVTTNRYEEAKKNYETAIETLNSETRDIMYRQFLIEIFYLRRVFQGKIDVKKTEDKINFTPVSTTSLVSPNQRVTSEQVLYVNKASLEDAIFNAQKQESDENLTTLEKQMVDSVTGGTLPEASEEGTLYFNYIFAGDILAIAAKHFYVNSQLDPAQTHIAALTFDITKIPDINSENVFNLINLPPPEKLTLNLATFPISYNFFASWFIKNIVSKKREIMPLGDFLRLFFNDCVLSVINSYNEWQKKFLKAPSSYIISKTSSDETIEVSYVDLPHDLSLEPYSYKGELKLTEALNGFNNGNLRPFLNEITKNTKVYRYIFIYGNFHTINNAENNVDDNLYNGIFHFFVGATTGILRDVKFTPIKMQSRFTAQVSNVINSKDGKPIDSRFNVIQRYDVDLTCFGFQYFFPGQTIFVDTSLLGFGKSTDPESIARKFTLGGYYLITKVSHDIQGNDFSTNIIAKFIGDGTKMKAA